MSVEQVLLILGYCCGDLRLVIYALVYACAKYFRVRLNKQSNSDGNVRKRC